MLNVYRYQTVATLQIQRRFQHRLSMNQRAVFLQDCLSDQLKRGIISIHRNRLAEHLIQALWAFEQASRTHEAALCQRGSVNSAHYGYPGREALPLRYRFDMEAGERDIVDCGDRNPFAISPLESPKSLPVLAAAEIAS